MINAKTDIMTVAANRFGMPKYMFSTSEVFHVSVYVKNARNPLAFRLSAGIARRTRKIPMAAMNTVISVADAVHSVSKTRSPMRRTAFGVAPLSTPAGAAAPLEFTVTGWEIGRAHV